MPAEVGFEERLRIHFRAAPVTYCRVKVFIFKRDLTVLRIRAGMHVTSSARVVQGLGARRMPGRFLRCDSCKMFDFIESVVNEKETGVTVS